jgi:carboxymethylenebutenolidase
LRNNGEGMMGRTIQLAAKDGVTIGAYESVPKGNVRGGLVVVQEIFGVNHHIRDVADDFANAGYHAIAPALFDRVAPNTELNYDHEDVQKGIAIRAKTNLGDALVDIEAAVGAAAQAGRVGIVGYCWGGTLAYASAAHIQGLAAAVGYYGSGIANMLAGQLLCPVLLHFGDRDKSIPLTDVEKIRRAHPDIMIHVYPAEHGFSCAARPSYNPAAADLAWRRTLDFLAENV